MTLKYLKKILSQLILLAILAGAALANWFWPFYQWFGGDTAVYRFIWLGIFFVLLDVVIEVVIHMFKAARLISESMGFSRDIHKVADGFHILSKVSVEKIRFDFVAIGSSGIWAIDIKDGDGEVIFNGDDLVQKDKILKGLLTGVLEKSFILSKFLSKNLNRELRVAPVIAFSSPQAGLKTVPDNVRGVFISSRQKIKSLIENTDFQLVDKAAATEVLELLNGSKR